MKARAIGGWTWLFATRELYKTIFMENEIKIAPGSIYESNEVTKLESYKMIIMDYSNNTEQVIDLKYYTPDIEDIRVGYEYEVYSEGLWEDSVEDFLGWYEYKFSIGNCFRDIDDIKTLMKNRYIRTAYLTKEQIEAEGWRKESTIIGNTPLEFVDDYHKSFEDGFYSFSINHLHYSTIYIWDVNDGTRTLYRGKCPSINEFRTIVKLLNI